MIKIKNIEQFRTKLFNSLKNVLPYGVEILDSFHDLKNVLEVSTMFNADERTKIIKYVKVMPCGDIYIYRCKDNEVVLDYTINVFTYEGTQNEYMMYIASIITYWMQTSYYINFYVTLKGEIK